MTEQLTKIVELQSGAIKGLKFDKVVVMGNGGNSSVGGFVQNLVKDTLPLHELGKSVGLELPAFLGKPMEGKPQLPPLLPQPMPRRQIPQPPSTRVNPSIPAFLTATAPPPREASERCSGNSHGREERPPDNLSRSRTVETSGIPHSDHRE